MVDGLDLGERLEAFVSDLVADGRYSDRTSVLRESLLLLEDRERKLRKFDEAIDRGLADIEAGRVVSAEEIRAELRARYGAADVHQYKFDSTTLKRALSQKARPRAPS